MDPALLTEHPELALTLIFLLSIISQWTAWVLRLPSIILLLLAGLAIGPAGLNWFDPTAMIPAEVLFTFVSAAVAVILFEGGLTLRLEELRHGGQPLQRLLWIGIPLAWAGGAVGFWLLYDSSLDMALVVGAILVVTGPTVIGPLLRQVQPIGQAGTVAKWEGILNDPIGAILAVLMLEVVLARGELQAWGSVVGGLTSAVLAAGLGGAGMGWLITTAMRQRWLPDHLHGVGTLAATMALFFACNAIQAEAGLMAVTIFGAVLANQRIVSVRHVISFNEQLRTLLIGLLFILLAARFTPSQLEVLDWRAVVFLGLLILFIRPLCVFASTVGTKLRWRERALLGWMAPRGIVAAAVASLFALKLDAIGHPSAAILEPLLYAVIVGTVLVYGVGARPLAGLLDLRPDSRGGILLVGAQRWARNLAKTVQEAGYTVQLIDSDRRKVVEARLMGLPAHNYHVLEEQLDEDAAPLPGVDMMLALTASDEANALAVVRFAEAMGRGRVYQLARENHSDEIVADNDRRLDLAQHLSGRPLADGRVSFRDLQRRFGDDAEAKITPLTEQYDYEDYLAEGERDIQPLLVIRKNGRLEVIEEDRRVPQPGDQVIALVCERPPDDASPPANHAAGD